MIPKTSVVIPVYNRFESLKYAVESVLAQTTPVYEIILVDDGSTDGTDERLPRYINENPRWEACVRYFRQDNQGPGAARNRGVQEARGEWLAFLDNDDLWLPQKLEWQFRALENFPDRCGLCFTDAWFMNNPSMKMTLFQLAGKQHSESIGMISDPLSYMLKPDSVVGVHPVWLQGMLTKSDLARRVGFDPALRFGDDDDFAFRSGCETPFCFVNMPMVLIDRTPPSARHHGASSEWDNADFRLKMAQRRYEKRLQMAQRLPKSVLKTVRGDLAAVHSGWANWFLQKGNFAGAREAMSDAAKMHLTPNIAAKWALTRFTPNIARKLALRRERNRQRQNSGIA
jgi:glycosyltransferase involved in cell wall biosynthesis